MHWCYAIVLVLGMLCENSRAVDLDDDEESTATIQSQSMFCKNVRPQHSVNVPEIMGMWYGSEIIAHSESSPGTYYYDTCVLIHLTDITEQIPTTTEKIRDYSVHYKRPLSQGRQVPPNRFLRLVWDERDNNLEYTLNYTDSSPGLWMSVGDQRGSMLDLPYQQFRGTIQVVKAVHDHIVLTFCDYNVNNSFFTIVLTRRPQGLSEEDLRSIRGLLARRSLATDSIRKVCSSSANNLVASILLATVLSWFLLVRTNK